MKPFNLEEALNGAKVVTRDGREVTQLIKFNADEDETLFGVVNKEIVAWNDKGKFQNSDHILDLFMFVEPVRRWVNVYKDVKGNIWLGRWCYSKEEAQKCIDPSGHFVKIIEINDIV